MTLESLGRKISYEKENSENKPPLKTDALAQTGHNGFAKPSTPIIAIRAEGTIVQGKIYGSQKYLQHTAVFVQGAVVSISVMEKKKTIIA